MWKMQATSLLLLLLLTVVSTLAASTFPCQYAIVPKPL